MSTASPFSKLVWNSAFGVSFLFAATWKIWTLPFSVWPEAGMPWPLSRCWGSSGTEGSVVGPDIDKNGWTWCSGRWSMAWGMSCPGWACTSGSFAAWTSPNSGPCYCAGNDPPCSTLLDLDAGCIDSWGISSTACGLEKGGCLIRTSSTPYISLSRGCFIKLYFFVVSEFMKATENYDIRVTKILFINRHFTMMCEGDLTVLDRMSEMQLHMFAGHLSGPILLLLWFLILRSWLLLSSQPLAMTGRSNSNFLTFNSHSIFSILCRMLGNAFGKLFCMSCNNQLAWSPIWSSVPGCQ